MAEGTSSVHSEEVLEQTYVYQNSKTGAVSSAPLKARQLILLLSPTPGVVLEHITPKTNLLELAEDSYDSAWRPADSIPILRQACAQFYFQSATGGDSLGPVTCRELSKLLEKGEIGQATLVWSPVSVDQGWTAIQALPELQTALNAFSVPRNRDYEPTVTKALVESEQKSKNIQDELEAFLFSTDRIGPHHSRDNGDEEEGYQSDNGTNYVKDLNGNWIHQALMEQRKPKPTEEEPKTSIAIAPESSNNKKRAKKAKFSIKNMRNWIYITGLPSDTSTEEIAEIFGKAGIIDLDAESQAPKIKIYRHRDGPQKGGIKGDASLCFARPESVDLAIQLFDEAPFRLEDPRAYILQVQRAKFEQEGKEYDAKRAKISNAKRKVAKLAAVQAVCWDESENGRLTGGRKGLCIVVLKHLFTLQELQDDEDAALANLEKEIRTECEEWGSVDKFTFFSGNPEGVAILKFGQPTAASSTVTAFNGRSYKGRKIEAKFWDGVTDYTVVDEEKEKIEGAKRNEEFGSWLEKQELPNELLLQVED